MISDSQRLIRRGDVVIVALAGDYGKPRPAVVMQADAVSDFDSIIVCPITTAHAGADTVRLTLSPTVSNGLRDTSEVMTDKITAHPRYKVGEVVGHLTDAEMAILSARLIFLLDLAV